MFVVIRSWFRVSGRSYYGISFIIHRLTGILMVIFVILHFSMFSFTLKIGYNLFTLLISLALFHGLNGLRLAMNELGIGIEYRKQMLALMVAGWFLGMGYIMYTLVR